MTKCANIKPYPNNPIPSPSREKPATRVEAYARDVKITPVRRFMDQNATTAVRVSGFRMYERNRTRIQRQSSHYRSGPPACSLLPDIYRLRKTGHNKQR